MLKEKGKESTVANHNYKIKGNDLIQYAIKNHWNFVGQELIWLWKLSITEIIENQEAC